MSLVATGINLLRSIRPTSLQSRLPIIIRKNARPYWWSAPNGDEDKLKIVRPTTMCDESAGKHIECKVAIVVGAAADISVADSLLYHGARVVILTDENARIGEKAAESLRDFYGKNRAHFIRCDPSISCQLEGVFREAICRYKQVDIFFNNLDNWKSSGNYNGKQVNVSSTSMGLKFMGKSGGGRGGIIVHSASIIGFMGWPKDPTTVYCAREAVAENTMELAKVHPVESTGVRIAALLKSSRPYECISLPDFPASSNIHLDVAKENFIGESLVHVISKATNGSTWLSTPSLLTQIPREIYFPTNHGGTIEPKTYEENKYTNELGCSKICAADCDKK